MKKPLNAGMAPLAEDPSQPSYVRELLDAGRGARVSGYDLERGLQTHLARVASGAPMPEWAQGLQPAGTAAAGAAGAAGKSALGWALVPALAALMGVTGVVLLQDDSAPADGSAQRALPAPASTNLPSSVSSTGLPAENATPRGADTRSPAGQLEDARGAHARLTTRAARVATPSVAAKGGPAIRIDSAARSVPATKAVGGNAVASDPFATAVPATVHTQPVVVASEASTASGHAEKAAEPQAAIEPEPNAVEPVAKQPPVKPQLDEARLEREMAMLAMTERVLKSDPARALKLARQGESEFAGSMFMQERQQLLLLALVKLGQVDEAKRLAKPYLARFPNGPFSDRVRRALASGKLEP